MDMDPSQLSTESVHKCLLIQTSSWQCYLLIPDVIWAGGSGLLHGNQTEHLQEMVLHDISASTYKKINQAQEKSPVQQFFHWFIWFTVSHLMIPKSSKYPPRPWVPKGSLKVRTTQATLSLFHIGPKIRFPNLKMKGQKTVNLIQSTFFYRVNLKTEKLTKVLYSSRWERDTIRHTKTRQTIKTVKQWKHTNS